MTQTTQPRLLTLREAAAYMHVSERTFRTWRERRIGPPAARLGGLRLYYRPEDLDQYVLDAIAKEAQR